MSTRLTSSKIKHLYWRSGFGLPFKELQENLKKSRRAIVRRLLKKGSFKELLVRSEESIQNEASPKRLKPNLVRRNQIQYLNFDWIHELSVSKYPMNEKMSLFWHNHFACSTRQPENARRLVNTIRRNALGNFRVLLTEVSKDPAMMAFLDTLRNRKETPNENFARELLELFTLGQGNYTERDIKEAARAFTGWKVNRDGEFYVASKRHDSSPKYFMGQTGNFGGEQIIDIILQQDQTALFICKKIYQFFVNDDVNEERVSEMALVFRKKYDIRELMEYVFLSDWFYDSSNIGQKIKSPIELIVGLNRSFAIEFSSKDGLLRAQKALNQVLFFPPNVGGWPGGKKWIDNSTLRYRMQLPAVLLNNGSLDWNDDDGDEETQLESLPTDKNLYARANWQPFLEDIKGLNSRELCQFLLNVEIDESISMQNIPGGIENQALTLKVISLPEYQMC